MPFEPIMEGIESATSSPKLSHFPTRRHVDPSMSTILSGGSGRGANDKLGGGSASALYSAWSNEGSGQLSNQAQTTLRIAAGASQGSSDDFRDGDTAYSGEWDLVGGHAASLQPPQQLLKGSEGTSRLQSSSELLLQEGPALSGDVAEASSQSQLIALESNPGSSAFVAVAPGNAGVHAGQRKQSGASSICSSAASIGTPGPAQTATSISTDRQSRYEGWATEPKQPAAQHARPASALSQGGCASGTPPCMPLPLDNPRSSLTAIRPNGSHSVVRQHPNSTP